MAQNKSFEQVLEEERREVVALLQDAPKKRQRGDSLSGSNEGTQSSAPRVVTPVRSMLDVDDDTVPRHSSLPENDSRPATPPPVRSMLDVDSPPPIRSMSGDSPPASAPLRKTSPGQINFAAYPTASQHHRGLSDASGKASAYAKATPNSNYRFSGFLSSGGTTLPKRSTSRGKKALPSSLGEALRGDLSNFGPSLKPKSRSSSNAGSNSSNSPVGRRASSPRPPSILSPNSDKVMFLDDGQIIDASTAYRRLSDANLALSQGSLSSLRGSKDSRLVKDYLLQDGEDAVEDSSDDSSSEDGRGRRQDGLDKDAASKPAPRSLLAAAEEEGKDRHFPKSQVSLSLTRTVVANQNYRSLLESVPPNSHRGKPCVHPNTSFDQSFITTPHDSEDDAEIKDIKHAQKLPISFTPIVSTPATQRSVRTIYRGNFFQMQQEARDHQRRVRKYLVATDLSDEAAHALEWTIGTVLRDGDTLLAIYCVDEEIGLPVPLDDTHTREQAVAVAQSTRPTGSTPILAASSGPSPLGSNLRLDSLSGGSSASPLGRRDKAEQERHRAVNDITERVAKLLRKTKLQVKVVVEVICCKSAKHLITEVIDFICPTLVILGSRGRSALKGYAVPCPFDLNCQSILRVALLTRKQRHTRLLFQLSSHEIQRPRHGSAKKAKEAYEIQTPEYTEASKQLEQLAWSQGCERVGGCYC